MYSKNSNCINRAGVGLQGVNIMRYRWKIPRALLEALQERPGKSIVNLLNSYASKSVEIVKWWKSLAARDEKKLVK